MMTKPSKHLFPAGAGMNRRAIRYSPWMDCSLFPAGAGMNRERL